MSYILVALGGAVGSAARYGVVQISSTVIGSYQHWGTFIVNVLGSFLMGLITYFCAQKYSDDPAIRLLLTTGFLGGFTTFSAYSQDVFDLLQQGEAPSAAIYAVASVAASILAVIVGTLLARSYFA